MKVCFGGTFNIIHRGHELIFSRAFEDDNQVSIGLTSDELVAGSKEVEIDNYETRKKNLEDFASTAAALDQELVRPQSFEPYIKETGVQNVEGYTKELQDEVVKMKEQLGKI